MQNIEQQEQPKAQRGKVTKQINKMSKIINNRFMNPLIYNLFLQKRFEECQTIISRCATDEFKLYISALIKREQFKLQNSLSLLSECQVMNRLNFTYLKDVAKNLYISTNKVSFLLGKYKSSLEVAKDANRLNSNQFQIFYILGKISLALNDQNNALFHFNLSIEKSPNEGSFLQIAKIQIAKKKYKEAIVTLQKALGVSEENPQLFEMLGSVYIETGQKQEALQLFKLALQKDNYRYNCLLGVAALSLQKSQEDIAFEHFKKAYQISPNSAVLWNNIGLFMFNKKKFIAAYSCLKRSLFLDPFRWDTHANLAILLMNNKKYLSAHVNLRSAIQIKKDSFLFNLLGVCLSELQDYSNSIKAFEEALSMQNNPETSYNFIICLIKAGERSRAKSIYDRLIKSESKENLGDRLRSLKRQF